ncbi:MAG: Tetratricopeptide repeat protein [Caulobacteraceae bacterium]|nr:Tetratricopeptide repeat protein [Caulobacteraceae bacterium]
MLHGWGAVHIGGKTRARTAVGINIVSPVERVEGSHLWIASTGGDASGWVEAKDVVLLADAIPLFTAAIARDGADWDAYLRRAEAEHALNDREAATRDYTKAIELHPAEAFLYLRRARHFATLKACSSELRDLEQALSLVPKSARQDYNLSAELYSLESGVYAACPDDAVRSPARAITAAQRAVSLDHSRPTLLTILAAAYASNGEFDEAAKRQRQALQSKQFPPGYRADAEGQLHEYESHGRHG